MIRLKTTAIVMVAVLVLMGVGVYQVWAATAAPARLAISPTAPDTAAATTSLAASATAEYIIVAWNDLGMHCYNPSFEDVAILPPYNTLFAQVIRRGNPPTIITAGVEVTYAIEDNTYSVGKTNFWSYAQALYGTALDDDIGLEGKGLAGTMDLVGNHFVAEGIPLTEYRDSAPTTPYPYQIASIVVREVATGRILATSRPVAPVSTEMHCNACHYDGGVENIATGRVETNILTLHDRENQDDYPSGLSGPLMARRPINCAQCHSDNALNEPGQSGIPSFSRAMHEKHKERVPDTLNGCYMCHPGPQTQCLRDVMSQGGMDCVSCHGGLEQVASNNNPWLNEPRCDAASCHGNGSGYAQDQPLYRNSTGHGGLYCAACHDSPHAIAPSNQPNDAIKFLDLQGQPGPLSQCWVCHTQTPTGAGPHGLTEGAARVPLGTGWNLVSLPVEPAVAGLPLALASIEGSYRQITRYDAQLGDSRWRHYGPALPDYANTLATIDETMGLWIRCTAPVTLTVSGALATGDVTIPITIGWNLVGYPSQVPSAVPLALSSLAGKYDRVCAYQSGTWVTYTAGIPLSDNTLIAMVPGQGYWLRATAAGLWYVPKD